jgi:hypothetical protein
VTETAAERFKRRFADAVERLCVVEELLARSEAQAAALAVELARLKSAGDDVAETDNADG